MGTKRWVILGAVFIGLVFLTLPGVAQITEATL